MANGSLAPWLPYGLRAAGIAAAWRQPAMNPKHGGVLLRKIRRFSQPLMQAPGIGARTLPRGLAVAPDIPPQIDVISEEPAEPRRLHLGHQGLPAEAFG